MPLPHDLCSHLQNAFRARHAKVLVPHNTQNLGILSILLRAGFVSSLTRGTTTLPSPTSFATARDSDKRIWAELKYRNDKPVLSQMELVSMPSRRVFMDVGEIRRMCTGSRVQGIVKPLGMGEVAVVKTNHPEHEWVEAREALALKLGGEVVCRAR